MRVVSSFIRWFDSLSRGQQALSLRVFDIALRASAWCGRHLRIAVVSKAFVKVRRPTINVESDSVSAGLRPNGFYEIHTHVDIVTTSSKDNVILDFQLLIRFPNRSRLSHLVFAPADFGEVKRAIDPQRHTSGTLIWRLKLTEEQVRGWPAGICELQIRDRLSGRVQAYIIPGGQPVKPFRPSPTNPASVAGNILGSFRLVARR
jgi:hypothetical protein